MQVHFKFAHCAYDAFVKSAAVDPSGQCEEEVRLEG